MIWLSTLSLVAGVLLARHFTIFVLAPAALAFVVLAIAMGEAHAADIWSIVFAVMTVSVSIQIGYFFGIMASGDLGTLLARGRRSVPTNMTTRPPSIFRRPVSR
jgi:hypothetical protein